MVKAFRKPIEVEAVQWFPGVKVKDVQESNRLSPMFIASNNEGIFEQCAVFEFERNRITIRSGDWIVTYPDGTRLPVSERSFSEQFSTHCCFPPNCS